MKLNKFIEILEENLSSNDLDYDLIKEELEMIDEAIWSGKVQAKWHPSKGLFTKSAESIATALKRASKNLKQAMSRLNFYKNRAGKNLTATDKSRLERAASLLRTKFA